MSCPFPTSSTAGFGVRSTPVPIGVGPELISSSSRRGVKEIARYIVPGEDGHSECGLKGREKMLPLYRNIQRRPPTRGLRPFRPE